MFLSGHEAIVGEVLDECFGGAARFFEGLGRRCGRGKEGGRQGCTPAALLLGLRYVDAPCGRYTVTPDGRVRFTSRRLCGLADVPRLLRERRLGEGALAQSHAGYFAHWHAMSTDPRNTAGKIRGKILRSVLGFCLLALRDDGALAPSASASGRAALAPNAMWVGMALHVLTDSYSPAHTVRGGAGAPAAERVPPARRRRHDRELPLRVRVHEAVKDLARRTGGVAHRTEPELLAALDAALAAQGAPGAAARAYARGHEKQLWRAYKAMEFEFECQRAVEAEVGARALRAAEARGGGGEDGGDIVAFQYYGAQSRLAHARLDLLSHARARPALYARMKAECCEFLRLWREAAAGRLGVRAYLREVLAFLVGGPFRMRAGLLARRTDTVAAAARSLLVALRRQPRGS